MPVQQLLASTWMLPVAQARERVCVWLLPLGRLDLMDVLLVTRKGTLQS